MVLKGTIKFKILENHPDRDHIIGGWDKDKVYEYSDTYRFDDYYSKSDAKHVIKNDLMLVAGGGYDTDTIEIIDIDIVYKENLI